MEKSTPFSQGALLFVRLQEHWLHISELAAVDNTTADDRLVAVDLAVGHCWVVMVNTAANLHSEDAVILIGVVYDTSLCVEVTLDDRLELGNGVLMGCHCSSFALVSVAINYVVDDEVCVARVNSPAVESPEFLKLHHHLVGESNHTSLTSRERTVVTNHVVNLRERPVELLNLLVCLFELLRWGWHRRTLLVKRNAVPVYEITNVNDTTAAMFLVDLLEEWDIAV